jgi:hypothetical protein
MAPTFKPKFRKSLRRDISTAIIFCWIAFRAQGMAQTSCAEADWAPPQKRSGH